MECHADQDYVMEYFYYNIEVGCCLWFTRLVHRLEVFFIPDRAVRAHPVFW